MENMKKKKLILIGGGNRGNSYTKIGKELGKFKRFIMPILAIGCCVFMVYAAVSAYKMRAVYYLITFFVIMLIGMAFYKKRI